jgi:glycosyltransferase involved in cell wall biosynthesis
VGVCSESHQVKLSIVVPCYKTEQFIPRCMDSLVSQTLSDIEIIAVDDGSPDNSLAVLRQYESAYSNIRVIHQDNAGSWEARWTGINAAQGTYVAFVDSDDTTEPTFAETLYTTATQNDADIVVCGFSRTDLETGAVLSSEFSSPRAPFDLAHDPGRIVEVNPAAWNKAYRRELLTKIPHIAGAPVLEDLGLLLLAYPHCGGSIVFAPISLVNYMVHANSLINTVTPAQVKAAWDMMLAVRAHYEKCACPPALMAALDAVAFEHLGVSMPFRLSASKDVNLGQMISATTAYLDEHFPTWRRNPYICASYAREHGGAFGKLLIAHGFYRAHLMQPFLSAYSFVINNLHMDIKW